MIDLFSKACGFRYCLDYQFYEIKSAYYKNRNINFESCIIRPFKPADAKAVSNLYNDNINTYYKFPLSKTPQEFCESVFKGLYKKSLFKFILEDKFNDYSLLIILIQLIGTFAWTIYIFTSVQTKLVYIGSAIDLLLLIYVDYLILKYYKK